MMMVVFLILCCLIAASIAYVSGPSFIAANWVIYTVCSKNPDMEPEKKVFLVLEILKGMYGRWTRYFFSTALITSMVIARIATIEGDRGCQH